jgi:superfamily II DNA or RNA helicase
MKSTSKKSREQIQKEALASWTNNGKKGTVEIITGLGKTKIAMDAIGTLPKSAKILFLAEVKDREIELRNEMKKWKVNHKVDFLCYQSAYKLTNKKYDLVIADEIHDSLTVKYSEFYSNNTYKYILGLSATVDRKAWADEDNNIRKGDMIKTIAPVIYTYGVDEGQRDGTSRKLNVHVIRHKLDMRNKTVKAGNKKKSFMQTEWSAYQYWSKQMAQAFYMPDNIKLFRIRTSSAARAKILYNLESKIKATKKLCKKLNTKKKRTILFGNSLEALEKITPNVVSSNNTDTENTNIRKAFDTKKINMIGSFKKLKQGANLVDLDTCVIMSYYSKSKDLIQRIGRMRNDGTLGNVYIFVTLATQEEKWFESMFEDASSLNLIYYNNVDECLKKIK